MLVSTEEKILKTAMTVFLEKGKHGTKMQEIADRANINKAMLHYYFRNKESLYQNIFKMVFTKFFGHLDKFFKTNNSFHESLYQFISAYIDLINENPQIPIFILREISYKGNNLKTVFTELVESNQFSVPKAFMNSAREAIQTGEIKEIDPFQLLMTTIGSCLFFLCFKLALLYLVCIILFLVCIPTP